MSSKRSILMIYTGGTIGMVQNPATGALQPFQFDNVLEEIPELRKFDLDLEIISFPEPIDSSNILPAHWVTIANLIQKHYNRYNGFVILHGSDTLAFTASALSFMLEGLAKPVVLTGSQLPIGMVRTDGKENLITSIEIAAAERNGSPIVQEVAVYFEYQLYRGNRTHKVNAEHFEAFVSANYPVLAEAGVHLKYNHSALLKPGNANLQVHTNFEQKVASIRLFPGITPEVVQAVLEIPGLKGVVIETFGAGNGRNEAWFENLLANAVGSGLLVINISQCQGGSVEQGMYEASSHFERAGVLNGRDLTFETAITKLMFVLGYTDNTTEAAELFARNLCGELTLPA